jgi:hypothetical protein
MPSILIATLDGENLPVQFSYQIYVPEKRRSTTRTANAVVVQSTDPEIIHGEGSIPFTIDGAYPPEFGMLYDLYVEDPSPLMRFVGYWGDSYDVFFDRLDQPKVRSKLFTISGQFQVMRVVTPIDPKC